MKRLFFTLALMFVSAVALNAQSLTGKQWCTKLIAEDGVEVLVALTFDKDGTCEMLVGSEYQIKEDDVPIDMVGMVTVPGTFSHNGKDLKMDLNRKMAEADIDYEIKGMDAKTKAMLNKEIKGEINTLKKEFKQVLLDGMPKMDHLKIVSLDSNRLVVKNDDNQEIPFFVE